MISGTQDVGMVRFVVPDGKAFARASIVRMDDFKLSRSAYKRYALFAFSNSISVPLLPLIEAERDGAGNDIDLARRELVPVAVAYLGELATRGS